MHYVTRRYVAIKSLAIKQSSSRDYGKFHSVGVAAHSRENRARISSVRQTDHDKFPARPITEIPDRKYTLNRVSANLGLIFSKVRIKSHGAISNYILSVSYTHLRAHET